MAHQCKPPQYSIVIPARDEERYLPLCLKAIREASDFAAQVPEIIVVVNRSKDRTEEIARGAGCVIVKDESKNLAVIRNSGLRAASGDFIITIDADSRMSRAMLAKINRIFASSKAVGGGVLMLPERVSLGIFATFLLLLPIAIIYRISGGLFFFRKDDFEAIGGFNPELFSAEDIDFAKRLKAHGKLSGRRFRTIFTSFIVTSCRKFDRFGDWYFVLHPFEMWRLLRGRDKRAADKVWDDFPRS